MDTYSGLKNEFFQTLDLLTTLFSHAASIPGLASRPFADWEENCASIRRQLSEDVVRVAVVGSIKSGKSTLVNSLINDDHLKRGAGVVTSIVTKLRRGPVLGAKLFFKSWDEVNSDMAQALILLPDFAPKDNTDSFDIRRSEERSELERALAALSPDQLVSKGAVNANSVLLSSYLKGYGRVREILSSDDLTLIYGDDQFEEHRAFVGNDHLAVYLKDIQIEINCSQLADYIEIADCQGSDSPNPLHLAMIQDYLNLTNLIVYAISSRTGVRQADIRFLSMIKQMGIMDNILFVVNCDFNEHENLEDLRALIQKVKDDLSYLKPNPEVFTFSALFNLFRSKKDRLSEKDGRRLAQWELDHELSHLSDRQTQSFTTTLYKKLDQERYALLLKNQLERMRLMVSGTKHWIAVNQQVFSRDADQIREIAQKIETYQGRVGQIQSMVQNTMDGSVAQLKNILKTEVDRFFQQRAEGLYDQILAFIRQYDLGVESHIVESNEMGFTHTMYRVYQGFKQALDMFMTDTINPRVISFIRQQEDKIRLRLCSIAEPYDVMIQDALTDFGQSLDQIGIAPLEQVKQIAEISNMDAIKAIAGITLPPAVVTLRYSATIKTEAIMRLGVYTGVKIIKRLFKKPFINETERQIAALKDGGQRMKRETERSIQSHLKDYKENIKFQYVGKLADATAHALKDSLINRFKSHADNLLRMIHEANLQTLDKAGATEVLREMARRILDIENRTYQVYEKINNLVKPEKETEEKFQ